MNRNLHCTLVIVTLYIKSFPVHRFYFNSSPPKDTIKRHDVEPFVLQGIHGIQEIIKVLETRLPRSCNVYNMAKLSIALHPTINVYSLYGDLSTNAIILISTTREDHGQVISISVPIEFVPCEDTKAAFISTKAIDWSDSYVFSPLDRLVSQMIVEISSVYKTNSTRCRPCKVFYMDRDSATQLEINVDQESHELLPLDLNEGVNFLADGWQYSKTPFTVKFIRRVLEDEKVPSAGLYVKNRIVSGAFMNINGLVGMLSTSKHEQGRGYATRVMHRLLKTMALREYIPCSAVELHNEASIKFHENIGLQMSHECDLVAFSKPNS